MASRWASSACDQRSRVATPIQDAAFRGIHSAVRVGGVQLDLEEHSQQVAAVAALAPELLEHLIEREIGPLAPIEKTLRDPLHLAMQPELAHDVAGESELFRADPAVGLRDVAHDPEGGGEERRLGSFPAAAFAPGAGQLVQGRFQPAVEAMAERAADERAQRAAQHESERPPEQLAPPAHARLTASAALLRATEPTESTEKTT